MVNRIFETAGNVHGDVYILYTLLGCEMSVNEMNDNDTHFHHS